MTDALIKKVFKSCLKLKKGSLLWMALVFALFGGCALLYGWEKEPVIYAAILCIFLWLVRFTYFFYRQCHQAKERARVAKAITGEWVNLPPAQTLIEEDYQEMIRTMGLQLRNLSAQRETEQKELVDYYTVWVHQIKTPLAVMHMLVDEEDTELGRSLRSELFRTEQYVEMALNYTRLESETSDLVIRAYDLNDLIRQAIRKYAGQFIARKIRIQFEPVDMKIVTDQKWFSCILEQILSNAVKYTPQGSVTISVNDKKELLISDTGIGIDPADVPRIFDKGFTGINGRAGMKSTGLGLYLCKKAADKLGIDIRCDSEPGVGTTFILGLLSDDERLY